MEGCVYVLSNKSMPDIYKIGFTTKTADERASELFTTGVPTPFEVEMEIPTNYPEEVEKLLHKVLNAFRVNGSREFFRVSMDFLINYLPALEYGYRSGRSDGYDSALYSMEEDF